MQFFSCGVFVQPIHDPSRNPSRQPLRNLLLNSSRKHLPNPSCTLLPNHRSVHHATHRATIAQLIHNPPRNTWRNTSRKQPRIPKELGGGGYKSCVFSHQIYGALWWTRNHQFQLNQPTNQPNNTQTNEERKGREKKDVHSANNFMFINYHLNSHFLFYSSAYNCSMCKPMNVYLIFSFVSSSAFNCSFLSCWQRMHLYRAHIAYFFFARPMYSRATCVSGKPWRVTFSFVLQLGQGGIASIPNYCFSGSQTFTSQ